VNQNEICVTLFGVDLPC